MSKVKRSSSFTPSDYPKVRRLLMRRDKVLAATIKRIGACGLDTRQQPDHLTALTRAIVGQQLSSKAAATIFTRFVGLFPDAQITAERINGLDDQTLRGVGLSSQKLGYMRDLAARILDGRLQLHELDVLDDDEVVARLTTVKGFGRWTAEMFLIFRLHRPDVLPVADLGIMTAVQRLYRLRKRPDPKKLTKIGELWRPYRSVACWYLWQSLRS
jgi:DNA-3-methyladenine glycosylase II